MLENMIYQSQYEDVFGDTRVKDVYLDRIVKAYPLNLDW
jgi:hypothetical protein